MPLPRPKQPKIGHIRGAVPDCKRWSTGENCPRHGITVVLFLSASEPAKRAPCSTFACPGIGQNKPERTCSPVHTDRTPATHQVTQPPPGSCCCRKSLHETCLPNARLRAVKEKRAAAAAAKAPQRCKRALHSPTKKSPQGSHKKCQGHKAVTGGWLEEVFLCNPSNKRIASQIRRRHRKGQQH